MDQKEDYLYQGMELNAGAFWYVLKGKFANKRFARKEAIDYIVDYHKEHGGICRNKSYTNVFKSTAKIHPELFSVCYGVWELCLDENNPIVVANIEKKAQEETANADKIIGEGEQSVYVYYYDTYKQYNNLNGKEHFPCKVGMTKEKHPFERIYGQASTCFPEAPHIGLIIKCKDALLAETALHGILKFKERQLEESPGKEWYMTNPDEVEDIYLKVSY